MGGQLDCMRDPVSTSKRCINQNNNPHRDKTQKSGEPVTRQPTRGLTTHPLKQIQASTAHKGSPQSKSTVNDDDIHQGAWGFAGETR